MNAIQSAGNLTKLEQFGYQLLDEIGEEYSSQTVIGGKFCVDAFMPRIGLVVQFDGDYWHGNPIRFPNPDSRQVRRMSLDKSQDAYMRVCGYVVFRIWESDIRRQRDHIKTKLLDLVSSLDHTVQ